MKITPIMLDQFAAEWTEMLRQQNAQSMEVEQLRTINKKLSAQVRSLEASLAQINQEHCELVKQVVSTRLEKEELEDELVRVKMALAQESLVSAKERKGFRLRRLTLISSCAKKEEARSPREVRSHRSGATGCPRRRTTLLSTAGTLLPPKRPSNKGQTAIMPSCCLLYSIAAHDR